MRKLLPILAALTALLVVAPRGAQAQTQPAAATLRVLHAAAGAPGVDVYLDGQQALESNDFFSEGAQSLNPGDHEVVVVREGQAAGQPLVGKRFFAEAGDSFTLTLIGSGSTVRGLLLKDRKSTPEPDEARVRIIHAADQLGPVDVAVADGEPFLQDAVFGSANIIDVAPGSYAFDLAAGDSGADLLRTVELNFQPGWSYTLVVTGDSPENLWVQAVVDRPAR
jgi:hypothetical protein